MSHNNKPPTKPTTLPQSKPTSKLTSKSTTLPSTKPPTKNKITGLKCENKGKPGTGVTCYNTKKKSILKAHYTQGKLKGKPSSDLLCITGKGQVITERGELADDIPHRLCKLGWFSAFPKVPSYKHFVLFISSIQNPGPIKSHNSAKFVTAIYANFKDGVSMKKIYDDLPANCKKPLDPKVVKECVAATWTRRRRHK